MNRYFIHSSGKTVAQELAIYGDIGQAWDAEESNDAKTISARLSQMSGPLAVRINSIGGALSDGLAIFNALRRYNGTVTTHIDGVAYSVGSLIAMAARDVRMAENAMLMIHAPWGGAVGNAADMRDMADILDRHAEAMISSYLRNGGPDAETIRGWLTDGKDHFFSASEAAALGLVDAIENPNPIMQIAAAFRGTLPRGLAMDPEKKTEVGEETPNIVAQHSRTIRQAQAEGVKIEAKRRGEIEGVFADFYDADPLNPISALHDACMTNTACDELAARRQLLAYLADKSAEPILASEHYAVEPQPKRAPRTSQHLGGAMQVGRDQSDKRAKGLLAALSIKSGLTMDRKVIDAERQGEYLAMSLSDIMAQELRTAGYPVAGMREDIIRAYLRAMPVMAAGPSHGTDSLPAVLGNIANLSAMQGWEQSGETWQTWTQAGTLSNYQTHTRANVGLLDKLLKMLENQQWEYGTMADVKQRITGFFHGLRYGLPLQAIVNDELGELTRTMNGWGEAASATIGDAVHALLFTTGSGGYGQSMDEDSTVCFHANHANYIASSSGAVPSVTTLNTARTAMLSHTDVNSNRKVGIRPQYLIHGPALFATVTTLLNAAAFITTDMTTGATPENSAAANVARAMNLTPVEEYRITTSAPGINTWVLAAARRTVEVAGVGGPVMPRADQTMISDTPGITYELSCPFGAAILDWRGLYFNFGA